MSKQGDPNQDMPAITATDPQQRLSAIIRRHHGTPKPAVDPHKMHLPAPPRAPIDDQLAIFDD